MTIDEILEDAVRLGSAGLLVAQSGQPEDAALISSLARAAEALDVALVDCIRLDAEGRWHSARRTGKLS